MMVVPEYVVFDLGRVVVQWDINLIFSRFFDQSPLLDHFLGNVFTDNFIHSTDLADSLQPELQKLAQKFPQYQQEIMAFDALWFDALPDFVPGIIDLIKQLQHQSMPLYAITNYNGQKYDESPAHGYDYPAMFIDVAVSGKLGIAKPDKRIFQYLFDKNALNPQKGLFIDDKPANIEAACGLGMQGIIFQDTQQLRQALKLLGLEIGHAAVASPIIHGNNKAMGM
ncbi:MAG: HAD-IA family hydrolase [Alphaproteobacteria bacterium]